MVAHCGRRVALPLLKFCMTQAETVRNNIRELDNIFCNRSEAYLSADAECGFFGGISK